MYTACNSCVTDVGDMYDTDMDDKMGLARSPAKPAMQEAGLDIQATQAGVRTLPLPPTAPHKIIACLLVCSCETLLTVAVLMRGQTAGKH